jgi:glutathione S-transferase
MKLIGSYPSPFVRRIRILLYKQKFEFVPIDVFSKEGRDVLNSYGPIAKIPILEFDNQVIWDSFHIANFLKNKGVVDFDLSVLDHKKISAINEMTDSAVILFQLKKFQLDVHWDNPFSKNHLSRIQNVLKWFEEQDDKTWSLPNQWLYCSLEWMEFRQIYSWKNNFSNLRGYFELHQNKSEVIDTAPGVQG